MSKQNANQGDKDAKGQAGGQPAPTSPQPCQQQTQPVQAKPEKPVFPSNSLLTEASQVMAKEGDRERDTKSAKGKAK
jgi:hypothetical protein